MTPRRRRTSSTLVNVQTNNCSSRSEEERLGQPSDRMQLGLCAHHSAYRKVLQALADRQLRVYDLLNRVNHQDSSCMLAATMVEQRWKSSNKSWGLKGYTSSITRTNAKELDLNVATWQTYFTGPLRRVKSQKFSQASLSSASGSNTSRDSRRIARARGLVTEDMRAEAGSPSSPIM